MRFTQLLLLPLLALIFFGCETEEQIQNNQKLSPQELATVLAQDENLVDFFEAEYAYDREVQIGIVSGGKLPTTEQKRQMKDNNLLAGDVFRLLEFVNYEAAATAFIQLKIAETQLDLATSNLGSEYSQEEISSVINLAQVNFARPPFTAKELIRVVSQEYNVAVGRRADCIYEFTENWSNCSCGCPAADVPGSDPMDGIECILEGGSGESCCQEDSVKAYNKCSE